MVTTKHIVYRKKNKEKWIKAFTAQKWNHKGRGQEKYKRTKRLQIKRQNGNSNSDL